MKNLVEMAAITAGGFMLGASVAPSVLVPAAAAYAAAVFVIKMLKD